MAGAAPRSRDRAVLERQLDAASADAQPEGRADLLLALGDACRREGAATPAREAYLEAGAVARRLGDPERLTRAALGASRGRWIPGGADPVVIALLEDAVAAAADAAPAVRARLLGRLAVALHLTGERDRRLTLGEEAVIAAEAAGDPATLAGALAARHFAAWGPDQPSDRRSEADRVVALATGARRPDLIAEGRLWQVVAALESGDLDRVAQICDLLAAVPEGSARLPGEWLRRLFDGMRALAAGRLEDAAAAIRDARAAGEELDPVNARQFFFVQRFTLLREQGRVAELIDELRDLVASYPAVTSWPCALAWALAESGQTAEAAALLDGLLADGVAGLPRDANWLISVTLLADVAVAVGDGRAAAILYMALLPHAGRVVVIGLAAAAHGPVDHALGVLAAACGDTERAQQHLQAAVALAERAGAPRWAQRSAAALATVAEGAPAWQVAGFPDPGCAPRVRADVSPRASLQVQVLGGFAVLREGVPLPPSAWPSRKARELLKFLATRRGRPVPRDALTAVLWPDADPGELGNRLSVTLSRLRSALAGERRSEGAAIVAADASAIALNRSLVDIDVELFLAAAEHGLALSADPSARSSGAALAALTVAERRYGGDLLPEDPYADWAAGLREVARGAYLEVARELAALHSEAGRPDLAATHLLRALEHDPYDERAHVALIKARTEGGRHGEARRCWEVYAARMTELGLEHEPAPA